MNLEKPISVAFCWSGGKDSALALHKLLTDRNYRVLCLFTTVNEQYKRVTMHGVREELIDKQAFSIGLPVKKLYLSGSPDNEEYETKMDAMLHTLKTEGITHIGFGDIFLEDLKRYRDQMLEKQGLTGIYPLWKQATEALMIRFLRLGFKTITCCVSDGFLTENHVGCTIDETFIQSLPTNVDVCGENGEYHTFCHAGPIFQKAIEFSMGEKVYKPLQIKTPRDIVTRGFWYVDLL